MSRMADHALMFADADALTLIPASVLAFGRVVPVADEMWVLPANRVVSVATT